MALADGVSGADEVNALVPAARQELVRELATFSELFGAGRSACPHGDSRIPEARNAILLRKEDPHRYGLEFDGNEVMRGKRLARWMTDRSRADGGWAASHRRSTSCAP